MNYLMKDGINLLYKEGSNSDRFAPSPFVIFLIMLSLNNQAIVEAYRKGYRVDNDGKVMSHLGNILKLSNAGGYYYFSVRLNGKRQRVNVHRLQAYQKFRDEIFQDGIVVRHLDGNSKNNTLENLALGTHMDNHNDRDINEVLKIAKYAASFITKHNHAEIINFYNKNKSYKKTMEKFNISSKGTLHYIINNVSVA